MIRRARAAVLVTVVALAGLATGCGPWLTAVSTPPPGRTAIVDDDDRTIVLSRGVAVAFRCDHRGPCSDARATSDDPAIADVRPAALARLVADPFRGAIPAATFVVYAKQPGETHIRIRKSGRDATLRVTVLPN